MATDGEVETGEGGMVRLHQRQHRSFTQPDNGDAGRAAGWCDREVGRTRVGRHVDAVVDDDVVSLGRTRQRRPSPRRTPEERRATLRGMGCLGSTSSTPTARAACGDGVCMVVRDDEIFAFEKGFDTFTEGEIDLDIDRFPFADLHRAVLDGAPVDIEANRLRQRRSRVLDRSNGRAESSPEARPTAARCRGCCSNRRSVS